MPNLFIFMLLMQFKLLPDLKEACGLDIVQKCIVVFSKIPRPNSIVPVPHFSNSTCWIMRQNMKLRE
jgi:hypothetical protein